MDDFGKTPTSKRDAYFAELLGDIGRLDDGMSRLNASLAPLCEQIHAVSERLTRLENTQPREAEVERAVASGVKAALMVGKAQEAELERAVAYGVRSALAHRMIFAAAGFMAGAVVMWALLKIR